MLWEKIVRLSNPLISLSAQLATCRPVHMTYHSRKFIITLLNHENFKYLMGKPRYRIIPLLLLPTKAMKRENAKYVNKVRTTAHSADNPDL